MSLFRSAALLALAALLVTLSAFHADSGPAKGTTSYPNSAPPSTKALSSELSFTRTGGFAGFDDRLEIGTDGVVYRDSAIAHVSKKTLTAEETTTLANSLDKSGLFTTDHSFTSKGADLITYTIRYKGYTVRADEDQIPPRLRKALDRLLQLLDEGP